MSGVPLFNREARRSDQILQRGVDPPLLLVADDFHRPAGCKEWLPVTDMALLRPES